MEEQWATVWEFPDYQVSSHGQVANKHTGRLLRPNITRTGLLKIGLVKDRVQYTRSVALLVADEFLDGKTDIFNTPVHLSGDQTDNHVENLVWRPRWFAWKYCRQFTLRDSHSDRGPIIDVGTEIKYKTTMSAATTHGLLVADIWQSILVKKEVFPTWQQFAIAK